jgi:hypothetical protein
MQSIVTLHHDGFNGDPTQKATQDQASLRLLSRKEDQMQWRLTLQQLSSNFIAMHLSSNPQEERPQRPIY